MKNNAGHGDDLRAERYRYVFFRVLVEACSPTDTLCDLTAKLEEVTKLMHALKLDLEEKNLLPPGMSYFV